MNNIIEQLFQPFSALSLISSVIFLILIVCVIYPCVVEIFLRGVAVLGILAVLPLLIWGLVGLSHYGGMKFDSTYARNYTIRQKKTELRKLNDEKYIRKLDQQIEDLTK